jgi:methanogenic corrinoid protein MtbC1
MGKGYRVIDCGKNCPIEELINAAEKEIANAIFISGLISTIIPKVREVKSKLLQRNLKDIKIVAGGGALKQLTAKRLNVDYVAETVFDGLNFLKELHEEEL